jgi:hypothetical protein
MKRRTPMTPPAMAAPRTGWLRAELIIEAEGWVVGTVVVAVVDDDGRALVVEEGGKDKVVELGGSETAVTSLLVPTTVLREPLTAFTKYLPADGNVMEAVPYC